MPYGLSSFAPQPDITSPGQPTGKKKGGFDWKKGAGMAIAAPLVAALANKMSGGRVSMGEALGALGSGFLDQKLTMMKERRHSDLAEESRMLDLVHDSVKELRNVPPDVMAKFPKLQTLSQKYQDALASDGKITRQEAAELLTQNQLIQSELAQAQREIKQTGVMQDAALLQKQHAQIAREGQVADFAGLMPNEPGVSDEDKMGLAREMMYDEALAKRERETPQRYNFEGQDLFLTPNEFRAFVDDKEQKRHNLELEKLRLASANKGSDAADRQARLAEYQADLAQWQQTRSLVMSQFDQFADPQEKQRALADFIQQNPVPRKSDYLGGRPGKMNRSTLDEIVGRYATPPAPTGAGKGNPLGLTPPGGAAPMLPPGAGVLR